MNLDPEAVIWSAPERERAGRPLLVLMHGYGSHEGDLFQLSPRLPLGPVIASVRAPIRNDNGWAWFPMPEQGDVDSGSGAVDAATTALLDWLDTLQFSSLSLLGFSQGACVALQAMRMQPGRFRAVVALSGFVKTGTKPGDAELSSLRPPVFWGRGTLDRVIPAHAIDRTDGWLSEHSTLTERIYEDLAHSISSDELHDITEFLKAHR